MEKPATPLKGHILIRCHVHKVTSIGSFWLQGAVALLRAPSGCLSSPMSNLTSSLRLIPVSRWRNLIRTIKSATLIWHKLLLRSYREGSTWPTIPRPWWKPHFSWMRGSIIGQSLPSISKRQPHNIQVTQYQVFTISGQISSTLALYTLQIFRLLTSDFRSLAFLPKMMY